MRTQHWALVAFAALTASLAQPLRAQNISPSRGPISPATALEWLKYGNERHMACKYVRWHQTLDRRQEVARSQRPYAIIVSCSDSQVPPEIVFDQGIGDLFVVRVAGNALGDRELASVEYAAEQLNSPLVVVMGHQRCGAVHSAVNGNAAPGHWGSLMAALSPAVTRARRMPGDTVDNAIRLNVEHAVKQLRDSEPVLSHLVHSGRVKVAGAYYNMDNGGIEWLKDSRTAHGHEPIQLSSRQTH